MFKMQFHHQATHPQAQPVHCIQVRLMVTLDNNHVELQQPYDQVERKVRATVAHLIAHHR